MGGHLPPVVARARNLVASALDLAAPGPAFVACSGGADSLALAAAAGFLVQRRGYSVGALIVDHGLQPGSASVAAVTAAKCETLGLSPVHILTASVSGSGNEADARAARYAAIESFVGSSGTVLLAHTLNDQAEQVLLGLVRGSGTRTLAGIPPIRGRYVRPFLPLSRADTEAVCAHAGVDFWVDPTNLSTDALRNKVRLEVLPALADALGSDVVSNLARTAELARDDADYLDSLATTAFASATVSALPCEVVLNLAHVAELPRALVGRVIRLAAVSVGGSAPSFERTQAVMGLLDLGPATGPVELEGHVNVIRTTLKPRTLVFTSVRPNPGD